MLDAKETAISDVYTMEAARFSKSYRESLYGLDEEDRRGADRIAVEDNGYDLDATPIDTLMRAEGMGFSVAHAMEYGDQGYDT